MVILPISDILVVLLARPTKHEKSWYQLHFSMVHIDQHMVQKTLTYVAPHLSQHTPAGCVVVLQIASKHDVEDATPPQKSISWGNAHAKDVGHEGTYCSKGTA